MYFAQGVESPPRLLPLCMALCSRLLSHGDTYISACISPIPAEKRNEHGKSHTAFLNSSTHISLAKASPLAVANSRESMKDNLLIGPGKDKNWKY